jgi:hypothetical protein
MKEFSTYDFFTKLTVVVVPYITAYAYIFLDRKIKINSGIRAEKKAIYNGDIDIKDCQNGNWTVNSGQVLSYSGFTLATVLLFVVLLADKSYPFWNKVYLDLLMSLAALCCITYATSLQFWNTALDKFPSVNYLLKHRHIATILQALGWNLMYLAVLLAVSFENTILGFILSLVSTITIAMVVKIKKNPT